MLLAGALFLIQGRDYDMAALAPLVPMLFLQARRDRRVAWAGATALLLLCIPHRGLAQSAWPVLPYYRIVILGMFFLIALRLLCTRRPMK